MSDIEMPEQFRENVVNPWLLGADPEFAVLKPPSTAIPNTGPYSVNYKGAEGEIGWDHSGRVWELRPAPSPSAYVVTTNLWKLLRPRPIGPEDHSPLRKVDKFRWKSGALSGAGALLAVPDADIETHTSPDTLGGHVHFGIQQFNSYQQEALRSMTRVLLELDILARKENATRLTLHPAYVGHDAIRSCNGHVEWRAAPSWLDKPGQAFAALTSFKLAGARPSSVDWTESKELKARYLEWLSMFADLDVDAFLLERLIEKQGFGQIQADPSEDFKPRWRREDLWTK